MKKKLIYILAILLMGMSWSCQEEKMSDQSIFVDSDTPKSEFDKWLDRHYVDKYNISLEYRLPDKETNMNYWYVPAEPIRSQYVAKLLEHMVFGSVNATADGIILRYFPKMLVFYGCYERQNNGQTTAGTSDRGLQINIFGINEFDKAVYDFDTNWMVHTVLHEFTHSLHQSHTYPSDFKTISAGTYQGDTYDNISDSQARGLGFVTAYATKADAEDVAETVSWYIMMTDAEWEAWLADADANKAVGQTYEGRTRILEKLAMLKLWLSTEYGIDIEVWKENVLSRIASFDTIDWDNLND
jgi:substrate import-associated zinc metallohydrolase lipoprotein